MTGSDWRPDESENENDRNVQHDPCAWFLSASVLLFFWVVGRSKLQEQGRDDESYPQLLYRSNHTLTYLCCLSASLFLSFKIRKRTTMSLDIAALDGHIERLRKGETLTENEVRALCEKVRYAFLRSSLFLSLVCNLFCTSS